MSATQRSHKRHIWKTFCFKDTWKYKAISHCPAAARYHRSPSGSQAFWGTQWIQAASDLHAMMTCGPLQLPLRSLKNWDISWCVRIRFSRNLFEWRKLPWISFTVPRLKHTINADMSPSRTPDMHVSFVRDLWKFYICITAIFYLHQCKLLLGQNPD